MSFIDGKEISDKVAEKLQGNFSVFKKQNKNKNVSLGVFVVGKDRVIDSFVNIKRKFAQKIGIDFKVFKYDGVSEDDFIKEFLKEQEKVDGVIIQLPLPKKFNTKKILSKIDRSKDVDLLNDRNILDFQKGKNKNIVPPVTGAILKIIDSVKYNLKDKKIVIFGNGDLVGKPFSDYLLNNSLKKNHDYWVIDSNTNKKDKEKILKNADLVISGVGIPGIIKKNNVKKDVFLIDAGTSTANKKIKGDISLECSENAKYFSKTPGGIGPVTVAILYENLWNLVKNRIE